MNELRATPFHARTAAANRDNAWLTRNGATLSAHFEDVEPEALAARLNVVLADISWRWRVMIEGAAAEAFLAKLVTRDPAGLSPGASFKALWLSDRGGVRGAGVVARFGRETFQLVAAAPDAEWIGRAAAGFGATVRDVSAETGGLALVGPFAGATLKAAELSADLDPLAFRRSSWRGLDVTLSRWGEHGGYEIWCAPDDAILVWDRLMRAGEPFGIAPAGVAAMDVLDLEAGIARPHLDFRPARDEAEPAPGALGLGLLVDETHKGFNGRNACLASRPGRRLAGIAIESEEPAPFTPLFRGENAVGHTLRSVYAPSLRRAIALASLDAAAAAPGTALTLTLPPSLAAPALRKTAAHVTDLPFLGAPASIGA